MREGHRAAATPAGGCSPALPPRPAQHHCRESLPGTGPAPRPLGAGPALPAVLWQSGSKFGGRAGRPMGAGECREGAEPAVFCSIAIEEPGPYAEGRRPGRAQVPVTGAAVRGGGRGREGRQARPRVAAPGGRGRAQRAGNSRSGGPEAALAGGEAARPGPLRETRVTVGTGELSVGEEGPNGPPPPRGGTRQGPCGVGVSPRSCPSPRLQPSRCRRAAGCSSP